MMKNKLSQIAHKILINIIIVFLESVLFQPVTF